MGANLGLCNLKLTLGKGEGKGGREKGDNLKLTLLCVGMWRGANETPNANSAIFSGVGFV